MKHPVLLMRMLIEEEARVLDHPQEGWAQIGYQDAHILLEGKGRE